MVRPYGKSAHPTLPGITLSNSGVDIETTENATVRAIFEGEVTSIQDAKGANIAIIIRHGDYLTTYFNLKNIKVKLGQKVTLKQPLGEVSRNAFTGKSILKFRVSKNQTKLNPTQWISRR